MPRCCTWAKPTPRPRPIPPSRLSWRAISPTTVGPAQPALLCRATHPPFRRGEDLLQARGAEPHRRPQDQQLHGPDPPGPCGWAGRASSLRPALGNTASPRPPCAPDLACPASSTWAQVDIERQKPNVFRMKLLGADVRAGPPPGPRTLKDAMNEAMRDWVANVADTYYLIGSAAGPHPYPEMVARFSSGHRRRRRVRRSCKQRAAFRTPWSPAWAAAPTPSACSTRSLNDESVRI